MQSQNCFLSIDCSITQVGDEMTTKTEMQDFMAWFGRRLLRWAAAVASVPLAAWRMLTRCHTLLFVIVVIQSSLLVMAVADGMGIHPVRNFNQLQIVIGIWGAAILVLLVGRQFYQFRREREQLMHTLRDSDSN